MRKRDFKRGFMLLEAMIGIVLCAFTLSIIFNFSQVFIKDSTLSKASPPTLYVKVAILNEKPSEAQIQINNKTYEVRIYTYSSSSPALLQYIQVKDVK